MVGRKARDFYRRRQWTIKREMLGFFDRLAYSHAQELADGFMQPYLDGEVDEVYLIYNEFRSVAVQRADARSSSCPSRGAEGGGASAEAGGRRLHLRAEPGGDPRRRCCRAT